MNTTIEVASGSCLVCCEPPASSADLSVLAICGTVCVVAALVAYVVLAIHLHPSGGLAPPRAVP